MYDFMLEKGIGGNYHSTFVNIAKFFESDLLDYKKADKVYRMG